MTLAQKLAQEALPCSAVNTSQMCPDSFGYACSACYYRPAVRAAIEKAIERCAEAVRPINAVGIIREIREECADDIRALLTDPVEEKP